MMFMEVEMGGKWSRDDLQIGVSDVGIPGAGRWGGEVVTRSAWRREGKGVGGKVLTSRLGSEICG